MKRKLSTEPDLYVVNRKLNAQEAKEISEFIQEYKKKQALKSSKQRKAA